MEQWYFQRQGKRYGPCSIENLKRLATEGKVQRDDLVRSSAMKEWLPAETVAELSTVFPPVVKPAPTPLPPEPVKAVVEPTPVPVMVPAEAPPKEVPPPSPRRPNAFLSFLHGRLPKPVLFGLYGALGALLGLLLLGELLFAFINPPKLKPEIKVAVAPELVMYPGSENKLAIKIARHGFQGSVTVSATNLTGDVQISDLTIPKGESEGELEVKATADAAPRKRFVQLRVSAKDVEDVTEGFQLNVSAVPATLQAAVSPTVAVYAGGTNRFTVKIARELFEGPVRLEVLDLPKDVYIPEITLPESAAEATMDVTVAKGAPPLTHKLLLETRSLANHKIRNMTTLRLHVEPPPGKLQLAVASEVTVFPGEKNRFAVLISRKEFTDPVNVEVEGLPSDADVRLSSLTIAEGQTRGELEVVAGSSAPLTTHSLRIKAKARDTENVTASLPFQLQVAAPPPTLQLAVSPKVSVYPGGKVRFGVKIAPQRFSSPVRIQLQDRTGYLSASPITIQADQTEGELEISASAALLARGRLPQTDTLQVVARALDSKGTGAVEPLKVEILAPPSDLQLSVSTEVEAFQGGKFRFTVKAARSGFTGPIRLQFDDLPDGVTLDSMGTGKGRPRVPQNLTIPANLNEMVLEGRASLRTVAKKYPVKVQATGSPAPDGKTPSRTADFNLTIKPLDPSKRPPPIDAIFVLDVTNSMQPQINGLRDGIGQFLNELKTNELEARVGLVTFRDVIFDNKPPDVITFNGEPFTSDPKVFSTEIAKVKVADGGDDPESSMEGLALAAKQPFREKALRVLLLITDEPPQAKGNSLQMNAAQALLREKKIDQIHLIINPRDRAHYDPLHQVAKGSVFDVREASRKGAGFATLLPELSKGIADTIEATGPATPVANVPPAPPESSQPPSISSEKPAPPRAGTPPTPPIPPTPPPPQSGVVAAPQVAAPLPPVAAVPTPPPADTSVLKGLQSTQVFPEKYRFQLLAAIALWTAALAGGIALALVVGQKLYLQQVFPRRAEMGKALGAGLVAGLLGGLVGQWFFQSATAGTDSATSAVLGDIFSRVLAWALLGGLLGAGMSLFVPNLRWQRGFLGGCAGGLIGALGFALFTTLAGQASGRWIGAALLGFSIGMMIAWAEMAFRRYWLEVKFGEREIRTFTLGPALVAVGGDEKAATVCVSGAPARALGYFVRGSRVVLEDFTSGKTSDVPPGDQRRLAHALLTVRSDANATPTGASLQLMQMREVNLMEGMPLTADDLPGLEPQGSDGVVALVSRRPNDQTVLLLRNRSKQTWSVTEGGTERSITPGQSVELSPRCQINFGQLKGTPEFGQGNKGGTGN